MLGGGLSLFPFVVEVKVAGGSLSLSLSSLSVTFYVLEGPAKTLAEVFGNAAGPGSQPLRWRRSITQTDREVSIGLLSRRDRETTANTLTLRIGRGQREREKKRETEREREREKSRLGWLGGGLSLSPSIVKVRVAGWWSLSVSFYR